MSGALLARWLRRRVYRVRGRSMAPWAHEGDYLLLAPRCPRRLRVGQVLVVNHATLGVVVKRVQAIQPDGRLQLSGDAAASTSPEAMGLVEPERVIGWVVMRVRSQQV